jgi:hypothetical protein
LGQRPASLARIQVHFEDSVSSSFSPSRRGIR